MRRKMARQKQQMAVWIGPLDLIEPVEHQHDPALAHGLGEPQRQGLTQLVGTGWNIVRNSKTPLQFAQQAM